MSRRYQENDLEKRWVFSRWRNVDNDSADVTSEGRSFQIRQSTTWKVESLHADVLLHPAFRKSQFHNKSDYLK